MAASPVFTLLGVLLAVLYFQLAKTPTAKQAMDKPEWAQPHLNIDRCVELHNEILLLGWEGLGRDSKDFQPGNWFDTYGTAAEEIKQHLSTDLVRFLERARNPADYSFHWYVHGFSSPNMMFFWDELFQMKIEESKRFVVLYAANDICHHQVGLVFDQETNAAIMSMDVEETGVIMNGRLNWYPLETVLEAWLDMIKKGKVKATKQGETEWERFEPWVLVPYTDAGLQETLDVFDNLVQAIEMRIPGFTPDGKHVEYGLVDEGVLDSANIVDGFVRRFLLRARRPQFRHIAPGLETITTATFGKTPFTAFFTELPHNIKENGEVPPLLLFFSDQYHIVQNADQPDGSRHFSYPYQTSVPRYPLGLYFHAVHGGFHRFDDECMIILPFGIGANGYARTSDGSMFGENLEDDFPQAENKDSSLYQPGHKPFGEMHSVSLLAVLQSWLAMVEGGHWTVGPEGVTGGMNEWKKADRRNTWKNFVIPVSW